MGDIGLSWQECGQEYPWPCHRCGARVVYVRREPWSGGGPERIECECKRCRHNFEPLTPAQAAGLAARTHVVVPVEATKVILDAYEEFLDRECYRYAPDGEELYRALIAAAQKEG